MHCNVKYPCCSIVMSKALAVCIVVSVTSAICIVVSRAPAVCIVVSNTLAMCVVVSVTSAICCSVKNPCCMHCSVSNLCCMHCTVVMADVIKSFPLKTLNIFVTHQIVCRSDAQLRSYWRSVQEWYLELFGLSKPVVAAINGHAPAGGCAMALMTDYR